MQLLEALADESAGLVDVSVKANFRALGQRFGKQTPHGRGSHRGGAGGGHRP